MSHSNTRPPIGANSCTISTQELVQPLFFGLAFIAGIVILVPARVWSGSIAPGCAATAAPVGAPVPVYGKLEAGTDDAPEDRETELEGTAVPPTPFYSYRPPFAPMCIRPSIDRITRGPIVDSLLRIIVLC